MRCCWAACGQELAGVTSSLSLLRSLPAIGDFLAPLVKEFAVSGNEDVSVLSLVIMSLSFSLLEGRAESNPGLFSRHYCWE